LINAANSLRWALIGHGWGINARTGHPVIIIAAVVATEQAITPFPEKGNEVVMKSVACIIGGRNNEMINLIAKYFL